MSNHLILQGLFDAAYFNAVFGNVYDQRDELLRTALLLKPGQRAWSPFLVTVSVTCPFHAFVFLPWAVAETLDQTSEPACSLWLSAMAG